MDRCIAAHQNPEKQNLFPIVQGGLNPELRKACAKELIKRDTPGFAIGNRQTTYVYRQEVQYQLVLQYFYLEYTISHIFLLILFYYLTSAYIQNHIKMNELTLINCVYSGFL